MPVIYPLDMKYVQKSWGWELWICNSEKYCGKKLFIKQGHWLSYHHHNQKDEVLFVEQGRVWFTHNESGGPCSIELKVGQAFHVVPGVIHQMQAIEDTMLLEFSTEHKDEDSIRTTRELVVDHGDNGKNVRTYSGSFEIPIPVVFPMPPMPIIPYDITQPPFEIKFAPVITTVTAGGING